MWDPSNRRRSESGDRDGRSTRRSGVRILVVEDDRKVARFVRQGLCEEGHAVEIATDGVEALDFVLTEPAYDLIILDVMLPGQDGFGVLKTLRAHKVAAPV